MNKHSMSIVVASCLAPAGCSTVREITTPTLCSFSDAEGHLYEAVDIEPLAALETAPSKCALAARDAMTCHKVNCAPAQ
jgi:hypothetical protein